jgi:hypothetical protein
MLGKKSRSAIYQWYQRSDCLLRWKENMEKRMRKLEESLRARPNQQDEFLSSTPEAQTSPTVVSDINIERTSPHASSNYEGAESSSDVTLNLSCSLGSFPGSSIKTLTLTEEETQPDYKPDLISCGEILGPDLISQGLISLEAAEEYFTVYRNSMEPCIYQILAADDCLAKIRGRSPLLTAAICTVGSFCTDSTSHKKCYNAFLTEVSSRLFSRQHSFDDIRALCIGAFWLNKVSSTLIGLGILFYLQLSSSSRIRTTNISNSCSYGKRSKPTSVHYENASYENRMLRAYTSLLSSLHLRPPLLPYLRQTPLDTRIRVFKKSKSIPRQQILHCHRCEARKANRALGN